MSSVTALEAAIFVKIQCRCRLKQKRPTSKTWKSKNMESKKNFFYIKLCLMD